MNHIYMRLLIMLSGSLLSLGLCAQSFLETVPTPTSPVSKSFQAQSTIGEVDSQGRYGIGVPLFSFKDGELDFDLSLSYQSNGIKVGDISGVVGLGWSINIGGILTRTVRGMPDEHAKGYLAEGYKIDSVGGTDEAIKTYYRQVAEMKIDAHPDKFDYNGLSTSGSFFYQYDSSFITTPYKDVEVSGDVNSGFSIRSNKGVLYHFDEVETVTKTANHCGYNASDHTLNSYNSAWYLSRVDGPTGGLIEYTYDTSNYVYEWQASEYTDIVSRKVSSCLSQANASSRYVTEIDSRRYEIELVYSKTRNDLPNAPRLDEVIVRSKAGGGVVQWYKLFYTEIENNAGSTYYEAQYGLSGTAHNYRLFLDEIYTMSTSGDDSILYRKFEYNELELPSRISTGVDYWGYYNGNDDNDGFVPKKHIYVMPPPIINPYDLYIGTADREIDASGFHTKAGILKRMVFPTGGYQAYEYEPNTYNYAERDFSSRKIYEYRNFKFGNFDITEKSIDVNMWIGDLDGFEVGYFSINKEQEVSIDACLPADVDCSSHQIAIIDDNTNAVALLLEGEQYDALHLQNFQYELPTGDYRVEIDVCDSELLGPCGLFPSSFSVRYVDVSDTLNYNEVTGGLRVKKVSNCVNTEECLEREFIYDSEDGKSNGELLYSTDNLRYKEEIRCDYEAYVNPPLSVLLSMDWDKHFDYWNSNHGINDCDPIDRESYLIKEIEVHSSSPAVNYGGSHINYTKIISKQVSGTADNNGYTEYEFLSMFDLPLIFDYSNVSETTLSLNAMFYECDSCYRSLGAYHEELVHPLSMYKLIDPYYQNGLPVPDMSYLIGRQKASATYRSDSLLLMESANEFVARASNRHFFKSNDSSQAAAHSIRGMGAIKGNELVTDGKPTGFELAKYSLPAIWIDKRQEVELRYQEDGSKLTTTSTFAYDTIHHLTKSVVRSTSDGEVMVDSVFYAFDYDPSDPGIDQLLDNYQVTTVVGKDRYLNDQIIQSTVSTFDGSGQRALLAEQHQLRAKDASSFKHSRGTNGLLGGDLLSQPYDLSVEVLEYEADLPEHYRTKDGIKHVLVWDQSRLVAKATNVDLLGHVKYQGFDQSGRGWSLVDDPETDAYTGTYSMNGESSIVVLDEAKYTVALWAKGSQLMIGDTTIQLTSDWAFYEISVHHEGGSLTFDGVGVTTRYDEVMVYPSTAQMISYVYDESDRIVAEGYGTSILHYTYDEFGRLKSVRDNQKNILKSHSYYYK